MEKVGWPLRSDPEIGEVLWKTFMVTSPGHIGHEDVQFDAGVEESHSTQLLSWGWHGVLYDQSKYRGN